MHADDILHWAVACWAWFLPSLITSSAVEVPRLGPHEAESGECNVSGPAGRRRDATRTAQPHRGSISSPRKLKGPDFGHATSHKWFLQARNSSHRHRGRCRGSGSATGRYARGPAAWQKSLFTVRRDAAGAMPRWHVGIRSRFTRPVAARIGGPGGIQLGGGRGAFRGGPMEGDGEHSM